MHCRVSFRARDLDSRLPQDVFASFYLDLCIVDRGVRARDAASVHRREGRECRVPRRRSGLPQDAHVTGKHHTEVGLHTTHSLTFCFESKMKFIRYN